jgi:C-terminal peptidase prc
MPRHFEIGRGLFMRARNHTLATSTASALFTLLVILLFLAQKIPVAPQKLYHMAWERTQEYVFDPTAMGDWKSWEHKYDSAIQSQADAVRYANEMLKSLHDHYTFLASGQDVAREQDERNSKFSGVGVGFWFKTGEDGRTPLTDKAGKRLPAIDGSGFPVIFKVIKGSPAEKAGIKAGDSLISIDGRTSLALTLDEIHRRIQGQPGTTVTLGIRSHGQNREVIMQRAKFVVQVVTVDMLPGRIGYLRLENFMSSEATADVEKGLKQLASARAIIFDLRSNPGGTVDNAVAVSELFIEQGKIVTIKTRIPGDSADPRYKTDSVRALPDRLIEEESVTSSRGASTPGRKSLSKRLPYMIEHRPVVILVNGRSASGAEMTAGAIKDNGAAMVIGSRTFGKGIGQSLVPLANQCELHVTSMRYYTPSGAWLGDGGNSVSQGIVPDIAVEPLKQHFEFGSNDDNQLQFAVQFLSRK